MSKPLDDEQGDAGQDPDGAQMRDAGTVERYLG
jgi:hypothetical protein